MSLIKGCLLSAVVMKDTRWSWTRENLSLGASEQQRRSLISAFVIHLLESFICKLATGEILIFQL